MASRHISDAAALSTWRKSSYSGPDNGDCLEVADGHPGVVPVRDSKNPEGSALLFPPAAWTVFLTGVKAGHLPG